MFWNQKASPSYNERYQLIPERETGGDETEILTLKVWFNNLCSIITYIFAQGYLN